VGRRWAVCAASALAKAGVGIVGFELQDKVTKFVGSTQGRHLMGKEEWGSSTQGHPAAPALMQQQRRIKRSRASGARPCPKHMRSPRHTTLGEWCVVTPLTEGSLCTSSCVSWWKVEAGPDAAGMTALPACSVTATCVCTCVCVRVCVRQGVCPQHRRRPAPLCATSALRMAWARG